MPLARIGDSVQGTCFHPSPPYIYPWTGLIVGASTVFVEGMPIAHLGDSVATTCPYCGSTPTIAQGSPSVLADKKPVAHLGDMVIAGGGFGYIINSATKTMGA